MVFRLWPELERRSGSAVRRACVLTVVLMLLLSAVCGGAAAEEGVPEAGEPEPLPVLQLAVEDSWPPYADAAGRGLSTDIVRAAFDAVGVAVSIEIKPYARVMRDLEAGLVDGGYNITKLSANLERFIFGEEPLATATVSFYYRPGAVKDYRSAFDVPTGTRIATIIDYDYGDEFESQRPRFREYKVMRQSQIVHMLIAGRVEAAVMYDRVAAYTLNTLGLPPETIVRGSTIHPNDVYVAFSRHNPHAQEYAALLDEGLRKIRQNGVYEQILSSSRSQL